ncbi:WGR domain-containing protein [Halorhodospira neutriphila]|nr:WGR domain-containing protein [Halorhodospira neutriphila]
MATGYPEWTLELVRIEPARGIRRFYTLTLERDLFAPVRLVRRWGRLGSRGRGQYRVEVFADLESAQRRVAHYYRAQLRRGYTEHSADPLFRTAVLAAQEAPAAVGRTRNARPPS